MTIPYSSWSDLCLYTVQGYYPSHPSLGNRLKLSKLLETFLSKLPAWAEQEMRLNVLTYYGFKIIAFIFLLVSTTSQGKYHVISITLITFNESNPRLYLKGLTIVLLIFWKFSYVPFNHSEFFLTRITPLVGQGQLVHLKNYMTFLVIWKLLIIVKHCLPVLIQVDYSHNAEVKFFNPYRTQMWHLNYIYLPSICWLSYPTARSVK